MRNAYNPFPIDLVKLATAIMTPEAMQAAMQPPAPPMDPAAMGGGMPMDPSMAGAAAADPMMAGAGAGGMPEQTDQYGGMSGARGGQIPPEILQDALFMSFLQSIGIVIDQASGNFVGPDGQPLSADEIVQIYQMFQEQLAQQQMAPEGGAPVPMDPTMGGAEQAAPPMDPSAMGGAPMGAMPPEAAPADAGAAPMAPAGMPPDAGMMPPADMAGGMPPEAAPAPEEQVDPIMEIASAVMSGVESVLEDQLSSLVKDFSSKMQDMMDRIEGLSKEVAALQQTTDERDEADKKADEELNDMLGAELNPVAEAPVAEPAPLAMEPKMAAAKKPQPAQPTNIFSFIMSQKS